MAKLPKLVRDKIPHLIEKSGKVPVTRSILGEEVEVYRYYLVNKLMEEMGEFVAETYENRTYEARKEEAADMFECCRALWSLYGLSVELVITEADRKAEERGGFYRGIILEDVRDQEETDDIDV